MKKYKLSKFAGRDACPEDQPAFDRIAAAFSAAIGQPSIIWKKWSTEQQKKMKADRQADIDYFKTK